MSKIQELIQDEIVNIDKDDDAFLYEEYKKNNPVPTPAFIYKGGDDLNLFLTNLKNYYEERYLRPIHKSRS